MPDATMIGRYLASRERAVAIKDWNVVREIDFQLRHLGYNPDAPQTAARAEENADAAARPAGRGQVRRSKSKD